MKQPEALRLGAALGRSHAEHTLFIEAAAELRRLHQLNTDLVDSLRELLDGPEIGGDQGAVIRNARALIEKATKT